MNYTQNCSIYVINGDPTQLSNIVSCQGDIVMNVGDQVMLSNVYNLTANAMNWTGSTSFDVSFEFGLIDTVPTSVKML
jgi:hypothetical protein